MGHSIVSPRYWLLKLTATLVRSLVYWKRGTERYLRSRPLPEGIVRETLQIPSRDKGRFIGVDLYRPADTSASAKLPVVVNWHGSGYVIPSWGEDREFIIQAVKALGCSVLDCDYRKGPEYPFPSGSDDAQDAVDWVLTQSQRFDIDKLALSGFSAGACLALSTGNIFGPNKIRAISCLYPPIDVSLETPEKPVPYEPRSGIHLSPQAVNLFNNSYLSAPTDRTQPRFRIRGLETSRFPNHIFAAGGELDVLHDIAKEYFAEVARLEKDKKIIFVSVEREEHAWDKNPLVPESIESRGDVYRQMFDNIKQAFSS